MTSQPITKPFPLSIEENNDIQCLLELEDAINTLKKPNPNYAIQSLHIPIAVKKDVLKSYVNLLKLEMDSNGIYTRELKDNITLCFIESTRFTEWHSFQYEHEFFGKLDISYTTQEIDDNHGDQFKGVYLAVDAIVSAIIEKKYDSHEVIHLLNEDDIARIKFEISVEL
jgi:hypothetical protein